MAITRVQQTQISGSLSQDDTLAAGSGLAAKSNLKGDLDALRSQVKRIVGGANWYTALEGSQDLADIYAAVHMSGANADFQGTLDVTGAAVFDSTLSALSIDIGGGSGGSGVSIGSDGSITADFSISGLSLAIGGGYGNTGASISSAGVIQADGAVEALSLAIGGGYGASGLSVSSAGALSMDGALVVLGASTLAAVAASGDLVIATDKFSVASASGNTVIAGTLGVAGMGSFDGGISVESGKLAVTNGGNGVTMDGNLSVALTSSLAKVTVSSTLNVTGMSSLGMLGASGAASFASTVGVTGASTFANVSNAFNALSVSGSNGLAVAGPSSLVGAVGITGILSANSPSNVMNGLSVTGSNGLSVSSNLLVAGNATVNGDLYVKGATTYIQTDNMIVKDAFIYLATGSAGTSDSGLVLSRGAGSAWDLILGQDSGAGEFVFAKQSVQGAFSSPAVIAESALVPAWMSVAKIGANEGTMVGSLSKSGSDLLVKAEASAALKLTAFGDEEFSLAADGAAALFDTAFTATTIIGALLETKAAVVAAGAGGNLSKVSYAGNSAAISAGVLTFVGQTLASADHKLVDVYLNGVMLSPTNDLTAITTSTVTLAAGIASSLIADDVIVVIARG